MSLLLLRAYARHAPSSLHQRFIISLLPSKLFLFFSYLILQIGHVYSFLDVESRKAFIATHPSVQSAPSVLDQIHKLTVSLEEADQPNPLLSFPHGERLQELVTWADFSYSFPPRNDVPLILALLRPQDGASHQHVMQIIGHVEELTILVRSRSCLLPGCASMSSAPSEHQAGAKEVLVCMLIDKHCLIMAC